MTGQTLCGLIDTFNRVIINPLLLMLFAAGTLVFVFGILEYMWGLSRGSNDTRENGRQHMLYGLIGMFIMVGAFALVQLVGTIVGVNTQCTGTFAR